MYSHIRSAVLTGFVVTSLSCAPLAYAQNIVQDPGFESADPAGAVGATDYFSSGSIDGGSWNVTAGTVGVGVDTQNFYVYAGNKAIFLDGDGSGFSGTQDSLTQTLATTPGKTYDLSFYADADTNNTFSLTFGGVPVTGIPSTITQNGFPSLNYLGNSSLFQLYSGTATATSSSTALTFSAAYLSGGVGVTVEIDNVSAIASGGAATPEPSALTLLPASLGAACALRRKRCRK